MIDLLKNMDPDFQIRSIQPGRNFRPKFQNLREKTIILEDSPFDYSWEELVAAFNGKFKQKVGNSYSMLDILYVLSLKMLNRCNLCGWHCEINRFNGERGRCGLANVVYHKPSFIHIAEESQINPSLVTNLARCSMRCMYCIDHQLWDVDKLAPLDTKKFWEEAEEFLRCNDINSIEFTNPTESLHAIPDILRTAPEDFRKPVVLNCHLFSSKNFYQLANPITDVWLPDLHYGNDKCAKSLSQVDHYLKHAEAGLDAICQEENRVIVRILVLPGHNKCCHEPAMQLLSKYNKSVYVSILDQYIPEHEAILDPVMGRRPAAAEIEEVNALVRKYKLRNILDCGAEFWERQ